ncbi:uncharacterized protein A1O5_03126 [Cladophialophora psammophila CBS 110553]|uniref:Nephrocystin 3-like N-terminal domain-containing protein n=1 Tax=Cladophialophora psammophila CBS 110553 TaxID=1182543 RepID=W9X8Z0_9EURO|nr:uncharacterized protein A1O5_03126 [Cladophialophora psammophila CBS 110553]EXJ73366.1 hypothetical protein A1O5_03126 [Cladophialophora psammophila CBS 110553]
MNYQIEEIASLQADGSEEARKTQRSLEIKSRQNYQDACARCLRSLSFSEMGAREASIEQPLRDTCQWIYSTAAYCSWDAKTTNLLWIKGNPGSGKSTLMKGLRARRSQAASASSTLFLQFFFNARGAIFEKTPTGLYLALMYSLLLQSPILKCEFLPRFLEKEFYSDTSKVAWRTAEIESIFHSMITQKQSHGIEILIDALDECKEDEVRAIIRKFERSIDNARQSCAPLSVCWSSRHYPTISMLSTHGVEVSMEQYNGSDIKHFVKCELPARLDPLLLSIQDEIISRANGVFLWAVLVSRKMLKTIDQGKNKRQLRELLESIPVELDDLFDEIFRKIGSATQGHKELALACFRTLVAAGSDPARAQEQYLPSWDGGLLEILHSSWEPSVDLYHPSYMMEYAFKHFKCVGYPPSIDFKESSRLFLTELCQRATINYMKMCLNCPAGSFREFNDTILIIAANPSVFGITTADLTGLVTIICNLSVSSLILERNWGIILSKWTYDNTHHGAPRTRLDFVTVFCLVPGKDPASEAGVLVNGYFRPLKTRTMIDQALQKLGALGVSRVIAVQWSLWTEDPRQFLQRFTGEDCSRPPQQTSHWEILETLIGCPSTKFCGKHWSRTLSIDFAVASSFVSCSN